MRLAANVSEDAEMKARIRGVQNMMTTQSLRNYAVRNGNWNRSGTVVKW